jgi:hypothetical protein
MNCSRSPYVIADVSGDTGNFILKVELQQFLPINLSTNLPNKYTTYSLASNMWLVWSSQVR